MRYSLSQLCFIEAAYSVYINWEPIYCIGGKRGPPLRLPCRELPKWEPINYVGGGGGPQSHPSDSFGHFNDREAVVSSRFVAKSWSNYSWCCNTFTHTLRLNRLTDELRGLPSFHVVGPRTFKWWGNSCHYHTFLQVKMRLACSECLKFA
jgi:hypothetical protein